MKVGKQCIFNFFTVLIYNKMKVSTIFLILFVLIIVATVGIIIAFHNGFFTTVDSAIEESDKTTTPAPVDSSTTLVPTTTFAPTTLEPTTTYIPTTTTTYIPTTTTTYIPTTTTAEPTTTYIPTTTTTYIPTTTTAEPTTTLPLSCVGISSDYSFIGDTLLKSNILNQCQGLLSKDKRYKFVLQSDGNAVLYDTNTGTHIWASKTHGKGVPPYKLAYQTDNNITVYDSVGTPLWNSATQNKPSTNFIMQNDGNLVLYNNTSGVWNSKGF